MAIRGGGLLPLLVERTLSLSSLIAYYEWISMVYRRLQVDINIGERTAPRSSTSGAVKGPTYFPIMLPPHTLALEKDKSFLNQDTKLSILDFSHVSFYTHVSSASFSDKCHVLKSDGRWRAWSICERKGSGKGLVPCHPHLAFMAAVLLPYLGE